MAGVFKAYDIRGLYPDGVNEELAYKVGRSLDEILDEGSVVVGRDMRDSSISISDKLIQGLIDSGRDVINIGLISTPMINFAAVKFDAAGGVQVTASHNPKQYNGMKFCRRNAIPMSYDTGIAQIELLSQKNTWNHSSKKGSLSERDIILDYKEHILNFKLNEIKPLKIVVDAGNGMGGHTTPVVFKDLPVQIIPLYFELDGNFPNHDANPLEPENMRDLQKAVIDNQADFGIAYDGDADRAMFVDNKGDIVTADLFTALISREFLNEHPGSTILYDLRSSWVVHEEIEKFGGKAEMCRVGHAFIKKHLRDVDGVFAGELSGHFYFKDNFYTDNADLALIRAINLLSREDKSFSELIQPLRRYSASGEINSDVEDPKLKMTEIENKYSKGSVNIFHLDGLSIEYDDWWFNLRMSNTEPVLRLNVEAKDPKKMIVKRDELLSIIQNK